MSLSRVAGLVLLEAGRRAAQPRRARLQHVSVAAVVVDRTCQHAHTQTYRNDGPAAAEARYVFPLPDGASVSAFSATFSSDGRLLEGAVRRLPEARVLYRQALDGGCRAALLEEDRPDVFQASVGGVGPGEEVTVALEYCLELAVEAGAVRLTIPSHVGERYVPKRAGEVGGVLAGMPCEPTRSAHLSVEVQCSMGDEGIRQISSPSHPDVVVVPGLQGRGQATARLQAQGLDRDVVLLITPQGLFEPVVAWEEWAEQGTQALMLSLVPKFELPMRKVEAVFLLDCSASMRGSRMEQSRRSVQIFLRSLPSACRFNIVTFGSGFAAMAKRSVVYSDAALATGAEYIDGIEANMGGTNIAPALRSVIDAVSVPGFERQIFVITDGKVSNEQEVIDLARSGGHRVFALGIGSGVSTFLVNGLARASQGHAAFAQDGDKLHPICISLLRKALTPRVSNMRITWPKATVLEEEFEIVEAQAPTQAPALSFFNPGQKDPRAFSDGLGLKQLQQAPRAPPAIFADRSFCAFALYAGGALPEAGAAVTLEGDTPFGPLALQVPLPQEATRRDDAPLVHRMAARALIRDCEEMGASAPEGPEAAAELLSLRFGLLCRSTAFVAVDEAGDQRPLAPRSGRGEGEELGSVAAGDLRRGCHVMIKGRPCKVLEVSTSKTGKHGHAKAHIVAFDMETGAKIEDLCPTTHSLEVQGGSGGDGAAKAESGTRQRKRGERRDGKERKERREGASGETAWHLIPTSEQRAEEDWEEESAQRWRQGRKEQSGEELEIADPALGARCGVGSERGPEAAAARALEGLLRLAAADGSFTPSHALWAALGATAQSAGAWASETVGRAVEGRVVATALALGCLSSRFGEDEESWGLVAEKAKEWLAARRPQWLSESVASMEGLLAAAAAMHSG